MINGKPKTFPTHEYCRWWLKRGHAGRIQIVNYKPFPSDQVGEFGFRYHDQALGYLHQLEADRDRRKVILQAFALGAILLACTVVAVFP